VVEARGSHLSQLPPYEFSPRALIRQLPQVVDGADVRGAQEAGFLGWLVRTGKFRQDVLRKSGITPDRILDSVADLRPAAEALAE